MHDVAVRSCIEGSTCHFLAVDEDVIAARDLSRYVGGSQRVCRESHIFLERLLHILLLHDIRPLLAATVGEYAATSALPPEDADTMLPTVGFIDLILNELVAAHHEAGLHGPDKEILVIIEVGGNIFLYGKVESRRLPLFSYLGYQ